jgi:hypothetical protein
MNDIDATLKEAYNATSTIVMPGSGSYGMEAVARQWATGKKVLVLRNGYFSYRWTDIFEQTGIPSETIVMRGQPTDNSSTPQFAPHDVDEVVKTIQREKPAVVFAPHVETSTGIILPDDYLVKVAAAVHAHGGLFVLDCIASGTIWVDMKATGVDAILSAPQKGESILRTFVRAISLTLLFFFIYRVDRPGLLVADHAERTRRLRDSQHDVDVDGDQHAQMVRGDGLVRQRRVRVLHHHAHGRFELVPRRRVGDEGDGVQKSRRRGLGARERVSRHDEEQRFANRQRARVRSSRRVRVVHRPA